MTPMKTMFRRRYETVTARKRHSRKIRISRTGSGVVFSRTMNAAELARKSTLTASTTGSVPRGPRALPARTCRRPWR